MPNAHERRNLNMTVRFYCELREINTPSGTERVGRPSTNLPLKLSHCALLPYKPTSHPEMLTEQYHVSCTPVMLLHSVQPAERRLLCDLGNVPLDYQSLSLFWPRPL